MTLKHAEAKLTIPQHVSMVDVTGHADEWLRIIEPRFACTISVRGNEITLSGDEKEVAAAARLFEEMIYVLEKNATLSPEKIEVSIDMVRDDQKPSRVFSDVLLVHRGKKIAPRTPGQKSYVDAIRKHTIVFGIGPAGTGKTYLAMALAAAGLTNKQYGRIVLVRPAVEAGEKLGYLPGTVYEKVDPYLRPLYDALYEMMDPDHFRYLMEMGTVEVVPLAFMRGRTLNDSFIVLDEAQNTSPEQMKMFLTRLGFGSKAVITGDVTQIDLPAGQKSGLIVIEKILAGVKDVEFVHLDAKDVVRHKLVQQIVEAYRKAGLP
ncbi:MAG: PhoH family protein [Actinomycetota bacterium]